MKRVLVYSPARKASKYRARPIEVDGIRFASNLEARHFGRLRLRQLAGEITDLKRQVTFSIDVNGMHVCKYIADATYRENGELQIEDAKGVETDLFKLKRKLMLACHGLTVRTVR